MRAGLIGDLLKNRALGVSSKTPETFKLTFQRLLLELKCGGVPVWAPAGLEQFAGYSSKEALSTRPEQ